MKDMGISNLNNSSEIARMDREMQMHQRLECLRLAAAPKFAEGDTQASDTTDRAKAFFDFVRGNASAPPSNRKVA